MRILILFLLSTSIGFNQVDSVLNKPEGNIQKVVTKMSDGIPQRKNTILWVYPETRFTAEQYERMELSVEMPEWIDKKIKYFLATDDSINGINPFLEWQLDVSALFTHLPTGETKQTDAFLYQSFSRDTSHKDFRQWKWMEEETPEYMRVRFAPPKYGEWNCTIKITTRDTSFVYNSINFRTVQSNEKGYLKVGESKRFFKEGDETFFPSGQNLVSPRCEFCFVNGSQALPSAKNGPGLQSLESWMIEPTVMKGFLMFQDHMKNLAANGGNYFREILFPQNQDIEWEKLGNYYGRMNRAWEMDEQIFLANELDIKIQLNVQIQFALELDKGRSYWNWSVDPSDKRQASSGNPCANPYNIGIETTKNDDPNTFFSDKTAKKFYKQKLRYIISRWGYSTNLAVIGLVSEIQGCCTEGKLCVEWMHEMASYLKNDLAMNQLLTPSFLGIYHDPENYEHPILRDPLFDMSTYNWYAVTAKKFQGNIRHINFFLEEFDQPFFYGEMGNADLYPCDTARIEWIRDSWMSSFTGNAGIGMNWDDPFNDRLRLHLGNIHGFVDGIDFDNDGNPWTPTRVIADNRKVETVFLISPDRNAAVGVISNRYYNWYLFGDTVNLDRKDPTICNNRVPYDPGFHPNAPIDSKGVWEKVYEDSPTDYIDRVSRTEMNNGVVYHPFQSFTYNTGKHYRLRLYGMNRGSYTVDFYNALTMEYMGSRTNWGPNLQIEYPEMNINNGFIAFKIRRSGADEFPQINEQNRVPIDYANAKYTRNSERFQVMNNRYDLTIFKDENRLIIQHLGEINQSNFNIEIMNENGDAVLSEDYDELEHVMLIENLVPGNYTIRLTINRVTYYETFTR